MNQDFTQNNDQSDDGVPQRLRDELARVEGPPLEIPPRLDQQVLAEARAGFRRRARFKPIVRWTAAITAVAACVAIVTGIWLQMHRPGSSAVATAAHSARAAAPLVGDINGDGKVDMLDAYLLARELASGTTPDPRHDVNGDGIVDQRDVDAIANSAVRVGGANP